MSTVHVLGNPRAGAQSAATVAEVAARLRAAGAEPVTLDPASRDDAIACLRASVDEGATRLVVVGGDGLVHLAVQAVAATKVALGIVPFGTGNDFARALGFEDTGVAVAASRALDEPSAIDALRTTHGWVASVATIGFAATVNERANRLRRPRGRARYTLATLLEIPRLRALPLTLELDGHNHRFDISLLAIANTAYFGGGMAICPDADPADGQLDVAIVSAVGRATLLRFFPQVFKGTHVSHPAVTMLRGRRLTLTTDPSTQLWGDGEPVGPLPIDVEVVDDALHIAGGRHVAGGRRNP